MAILWPSGTEGVNFHSDVCMYVWELMVVDHPYLFVSFGVACLTCCYVWWFHDSLHASPIGVLTAPSSRRPEDLEVLAAQLNELGSGALGSNPNTNANRASQRISHITQALDSDSDDSDGEIQQVCFSFVQEKNVPADLHTLGGTIMTRSLALPIGSGNKVTGKPIITY